MKDFHGGLWVALGVASGEDSNAWSVMRALASGWCPMRALYPCWHPGAFPTPNAWHSGTPILEYLSTSARGELTHCEWRHFALPHLTTIFSWYKGEGTGTVLCCLCYYVLLQPLGGLWVVVGAVYPKPIKLREMSTTVVMEVKRAKEPILASSQKLTHNWRMKKKDKQQRSLKVLGLLCCAYFCSVVSRLAFVVTCYQLCCILTLIYYFGNVFFFFCSLVLVLKKGKQSAPRFGFLCPLSH